MRHGYLQRRLAGHFGLAGACLASVVALLPMAAAALDLGDASPSSVHECLRAAVAQTARYEGSQWQEPPTEEFLLAGDLRVHPYRLVQDDCVGFIAAGAKYVQDIDLGVRSEDGRMLSRADGPSATPYMTFCGRAGDRVFVTLRVLDGQGEVSFGVLGHAREPFAALPLLARCPWIGAPRPAGVDVGPEPGARSIPQELENTGATLAALGYKPGTLVAYGTLAAGQHEARGLQLAGARCYALVAVGSRDVVDLDLRLFGAEHVATQPLAADTSRRRNASIKLCTVAPARYLLDVALFGGEGAYAVQSFELQEPEPRSPPGIDQSARIVYAETSRRMLQRGLQPQVLTTVIVTPAEIVRIPVRLPAAGCYALSALPVGEARAGALELGLTDDSGGLLAIDASSTRAPLVYHCAAAPETVRVAVRTRDAHGSSRLALLMGHDTVTPEASP